MSSTGSRVPAQQLVWGLLCTAVLVVIAVADLVLGPAIIVTSLVIVAPLLASLRLTARATLAFGLAAVVIAVVAGLWNHYFLARAHVVRIVIVVAGSALAVAVAVVRERSAREARAKARLMARAEAALAQLDAVYGSVPLGLAYLDRDLRVVRVNAMLAEICGVRAGDLIGRRVGDAIEGLGPATARSAALTLQRGEVTERAIDRPLFDHPGAPQTALITCHPVRASDGSVAGVGLLVRDITDERARDRRRRAQLGRAGQERARLTDVLESLGSGVVLRDPSGRLLLANERAAEIWGAPIGDVDAARGLAEGRVLTEDGGPLERARWPLARALRGGETVREDDLVIARPDGRRLTVEVRAMPVRDEDGQIMAAVTVLTDVTEARRDRAALEMLADIGQLLDRPLEVENRLAALAEMLMPRLGEACVIHVLDDDGNLERTFAAAIEPELDGLVREMHAGRPLDLAGDRPPALAMRTGEPVRFDAGDAGVIDRVARDDGDRERFRRAGARAGLSVPMPATAGVIGALSMASTTRDAYDDSDVRLLAMVAGRAALVIDNARRYESQQRIAATLQRELLPPGLPDWPGLDVAAVYRPGSGASAVGGDFYDFFTTPDGRRAIVIGDVSGKGVEAAALTTVARHGLRVAARTAPTQRDALESVNLAIGEDAGGERFCTLAYALIEPGADGAHMVEVTCAGHPPAILRRADGTTETVGRPGTLLGIFPGVAVEPARTRLWPGDALVLYTDGLTEAPVEGGLLGERGVREALTSFPPLAAAAVVERLEALASSGPAGRRDDLAIVVARARPA